MEQTTDTTDIITYLADARERLGENEYKKRIALFQEQMAANAETKRIAEQARAAAKVREVIAERKRSALTLADALDSIAPHIANLEQANKRVIECGLSRQTVDRLRHDDAPLRVKNIDVTKFRADIEATNVVLTTELCK